MNGFRVSINGKEFATTGVASGNGVLNVAVSTFAGYKNNDYYLHVGGLDNTIGEQGEHFRWDVPELAIGDEITIRLIEVEADQIDTPHAKHLDTTVRKRAHQTVLRRVKRSGPRRKPRSAPTL